MLDACDLFGSSRVAEVEAAPTTTHSLSTLSPKEVADATGPPQEVVAKVEATGPQGAVVEAIVAVVFEALVPEVARESAPVRSQELAKVSILALAPVLGHASVSERVPASVPEPTAIGLSQPRQLSWSVHNPSVRSMSDSFFLFFQ